jgi:hypothetical protein
MPLQFKGTVDEKLAGWGDMVVRGRVGLSGNFFFAEGTDIHPWRQMMTSGQNQARQARQVARL